MPSLARLAAPLSALILASFAIAAEPAPPAPPASAAATMFDHELRRLHSDEVVRLAPRYAGHPVLVVNTASHCGYTGQFKGLEALHQRYKDEGLKVAGFSSDDFKQEADDEAKAAEVCFLNYGVTFDMYAPIHVRGPQAHPLFQELARQSAEPRWNFHKYVIGRDGRVVAAFPSRVEPDAPELREAIEKAL